jgi:glycosyltransferase involved in cell wall biosynthesis
MEGVLLDMGCPKNKLVYNVYGPRLDFQEITPKFTKQQFVAVGRFTNKKAPYYTILAFKEVLAEFPNAQLLMAGDGALLESCQNLVCYYGLSEQVQFLGVISQEHYRKLLSESLAFVQHSVTATDGDMEGTPLSILEASAAGLPVIATRHAGIPDVVVDGKTGLLCDEHDVNTMAINMKQLLINNDYAKQLGHAGKQLIQEKFNIASHIEKLQETLESTMSKS